MFVTRPTYTISYKRRALLDAYEGRKDRLAWNLCVVAGQKLIG